MSLNFVFLSIVTLERRVVWIDLQDLNLKMKMYAAVISRGFSMHTLEVETGTKFSRVHQGVSFVVYSFTRSECKIKCLLS